MVKHCRILQSTNQLLAVILITVNVNPRKSRQLLSIRMVEIPLKKIIPEIIDFFVILTSYETSKLIDNKRERICQTDEAKELKIAPRPRNAFLVWSL
jgi:hypothetical protein